MAWFNKFPWTNFHELNLDWILRVCGGAEQALPKIEKAVEDSSEAVENANSAIERAETAIENANSAGEKVEKLSVTAVTVGNSEGARVVRGFNTQGGYKLEFYIPEGSQGVPGADAESNYIVNSNFKVNQRGQSEYNGRGYTVDCWFSASDSNVVTVIDNGISCTLPISQIVEIPVDGDYTVVLVKPNGDIVSASGDPRETFGTTGVTVSTVTGADNIPRVKVTLTAGTYSAVGLFPGLKADNPPTVYTPDTASELLRCQYFLKVVPANFVFVGHALYTTRLTVNSDLLFGMRKSTKIIFPDGIAGVLLKAGVAQATNVTSSDITEATTIAQTLRFDFANGSLEKYSIYGIYFTKQIYISAEYDI